MKDSTSTSASRVRVGVRIRPLASKEIQQGGKVSVAISPPSISIGKRQFTYDHIFDSSVDQEELYKSGSAPLLKSFIDGYNATIMAYGQTGSGKTFTMGSEAHTQSEGLSQVGLIPRFITDFFVQLQQKKNSSDKGEDDGGPALLDYSLKASFLEVYGEDVYDLLDSNRKSLPLREDSGGGVVIAGLTSCPISTPVEALHVLHEGTMNRTTAATLMNLTSSRSHAVFTIYLSQTFASKFGEKVEVTSVSKFTFVDLAGSERMKKTGAEGERAREGIKINEGLLALGNVINALADEERIAKDKKIHVPYRQSKLTRLLQDALGGNSQTLFLACVSPSDTNASETLSTLHYANRARNIRNAPKKNVDAQAAELQRLHALTHVLQCELVKSRFQTDEDAEEEIGHVDDCLMERSDVEEYMNRINIAASEMSGGQKSAFALIHSPDTDTNSTSSQLKSAALQPSGSSESVHILDATPNKTISERFDDSFLVDVNPDEDMAILDRLLDLQQNDHDYDKDKKNGDEQLKRLDGELKDQGAMLLQLRESLKVYHSLKTKYEELMAEVQQLEAEKVGLANQLEKSSADPSTGCSAAIKRQLEKVELSLSRARRETLCHRKKYRSAEEQAKKCRVLERQIGELKQAKMTLVKKQKETAARYKDNTEAKTKELLSLRRKEKAATTGMTKLKTEMQHHKNNLEKRKNYCSKLSEKLKQTELHLMKLISMRQRELVERASLAGGTRGRTEDHVSDQHGTHSQRDVNASTLTNEEVKSTKFIFGKMVWDRVNQTYLQNQYEEHVSMYSETMSKIVAHVKALKAARERHLLEQSNESKETIQEIEENVSDLELKLELVASGLDEIKSKLPMDTRQSVLDGEDAVKTTMSTMSSHVLRTMLLENFSKLVEAEGGRKKLVDSITRKDAALLSFESEVDVLNSKIVSFSRDLTDRRVLAASFDDPFDVIQQLRAEKAAASEHIGERVQALEESTSRVHTLETELKNSARELAKTKEELILVEASLARQGSAVESKETLGRLQEVWETLGTEAADREIARNEIRFSLKNTCTRTLNEALKLKATTEEEIRILSARLDSIQKALGISTDSNSDQPKSDLLAFVQALREQFKKLEIPFKYASARRERFLLDTFDLSTALGVSTDQLSPNLQVLIGCAEKPVYSNADVGRQKRASMMLNVQNMVGLLGSFDDGLPRGDVLKENSKLAASSAEWEDMLLLPQNSLENSFLSRCEKEVSTMRVQKSEILAKNRQIQTEIATLMRDIHMGGLDLVAITGHSKEKETPEWWDRERAEEIVREITAPSYRTGEIATDLQHLKFIHEALQDVANCRRTLTTALRTIVESAQKTLLDIVGRELDAREAYASFHDALFRLPALSKDLSLACISEMEALVVGVEAMTQSETEALTVVWEAVNISSDARRDFWGKVENPGSKVTRKQSTPFDELEMQLGSCTEEWIVVAVEKAVVVYRDLENKLEKLELIHLEVERLRSKQDTKSQILSLDSEIRILNAKLVDFEELQCSKQRLITKKSSGALLLKEERFRKQMQAKFVSKLGQLASLLRSWGKEESQSFNASLLSDDVRKLLTEPMENWVEKRTKFMPLRTVQTKTLVRKRPFEAKNTSGDRQRASRPDVGFTPPKKKMTTTTIPQFQSRSKDSSTRSGKTERRAKVLSASKARKPAQRPTQLVGGKHKHPGNEASPRPAKQSRRKESKTLPPFGRILAETSSPGSHSKENVQKSK